MVSEAVLNPEGVQIQSLHPVSAVAASLEPVPAGSGGGLGLSIGNRNNPPLLTPLQPLKTCSKEIILLPPLFHLLPGMGGIPHHLRATRLCRVAEVEVGTRRQVGQELFKQPGNVGHIVHTGQSPVEIPVVNQALGFNPPGQCRFQAGHRQLREHMGVCILDRKPQLPEKLQLCLPLPEDFPNFQGFSSEARIGVKTAVFVHEAGYQCPGQHRFYRHLTPLPREGEVNAAAHLRQIPEQLRRLPDCRAAGQEGNVPDKPRPSRLVNSSIGSGT